MFQQMPTFRGPYHKIYQMVFLQTFIKLTRMMSFFTKSSGFEFDRAVFAIFSKNLKNVFLGPKKKNYPGFFAVNSHKQSPSIAEEVLQVWS